MNTREEALNLRTKGNALAWDRLFLRPSSVPSVELAGGEDCNFNLPLFRRGCKTLIQIYQSYGINNPLLPKWKDILEKLQHVWLN